VCSATSVDASRTRLSEHYLVRSQETWNHTGSDPASGLIKCILTLLHSRHQDGALRHSNHTSREGSHGILGLSSDGPRTLRDRSNEDITALRTGRTGENTVAHGPHRNRTSSTVTKSSVGRGHASVTSRMHSDRSQPRQPSTSTATAATSHPEPDLIQGVGSWASGQAKSQPVVSGTAKDARGPRSIVHECNATMRELDAHRSSDGTPFAPFRLTRTDVLYTSGRHSHIAGVHEAEYQPKSVRDGSSLERIRKM
jgi:hypothetical protein